MNGTIAVWGWVAALALAGCGGSAQTDGAATAEASAPVSGGERRAEATPAPAAAPAATPAPAVAAPAPAPRVTFPRYTEIQAHLRGSARGERCFQNNIISADLTDSYVDGDFDGDGVAERVYQTPDCLVVAAQRGERWEVSAMAPRSVGRDVEAVRLRAGSVGGRAVIEATDLRGTQRATTRWRYSGSALDSLE